MRRRTMEWRLVVPVPAREVFAVMEQMIGTPPYRFEATGPDTARIVESERRNVLGYWSPARRRLQSVTCSVTSDPDGRIVAITAVGGTAAVARARQLVEVLSRGREDSRTIYRERRLPPGPVSLVASWAGTPYQLFLEPRLRSERGRSITTATPLVAVEGTSGSFCRVQLPDGAEGYVETDQIVAAPARATRDAQLEAARHG